MRQCCFSLVCALLALFLPACSQHLAYRYQHDLNIKIHRYAHYASDELKPLFASKGLHYPPREITLLAFKQNQRLELWARDSLSWVHIKDFSILAASGHLGPKLHEGDRQVPEGIYKIVALNPDSHYTLSMELNYPNAMDRYYARQEQRTHLGNEIFIHGKNQSIGCLAVGDRSIEQLFVLTYLVGLDHAKVIIAPNDLRKHAPRYAKSHPHWLPNLYRAIKQKLMRYIE